MIRKYNKPAIWLHWLTVALIIIQLSLGFLLEDLHSLIKAHLVFGLLIILIGTIRLSYRLTHSTPPQPSFLSCQEKKLAKIGHKFLYVFLFATPLSGIATYWISENFSIVHNVCIYSFLTLITGHILMTAKHIFIDKNNILKRII